MALSQSNRENKSDLQATIAQNFANQRDSTHGVAANASAIRLILMMRSAYPDIQTHLLTDVDNKKRAKLQVTKSEKKQVEERLQAQASLIDCLDKTIQQLEKNSSVVTIPEVEQKHPDIRSTIELIKRIQQLNIKQCSPLKAIYLQYYYYSNLKDDNAIILAIKKLIFIQMQSLAKTCPELQQDFNVELSTGKIFNVATKENDSVTASPAETLNLVCRAISDSNRYLKEQQNDIDRVISFCARCLELQIEVEKGQFAKCSTGRKHDLVFILDGSYLDKPKQDESAKPVKLIEDISIFLLERLTKFLEREIKKVKKISPDEISQLTIAWMSPEDKDTAPVIEFLRKQYPSSDRDPDSKWKTVCTVFLSAECMRHGLDPRECRLQDQLAAVDTLSCPTIKSTTLSLVQAIVKAPSIDPLGSPELCRLTASRNRALEIFRAEMKDDPDTLKHAAAIQMFYNALQLADNLHQYRHLTEFFGKDEVVGFDASCQAVRKMLSTYFDSYHLNRKLDDPFNQQFETVRSNFFDHEKTFKNKYHVDEIHNFFAKLTEERFTAAYERLKVFGSAAIFFSDDMLGTLFKTQVSVLPASSENADKKVALDLTSYQVNQIILHALTVPCVKWSKQFCFTLRIVALWLSEKDADDSVALVGLKQSYPPKLLGHLLLILYFQETFQADDGIKAKYAHVLVSDCESVIYGNTFIRLFAYQESQLSESDRIIILAWIGNYSNSIEPVDYNQRLSSGATALYVAAENGNHVLASYLLNQKNVDFHLGLYEWQWTPLLVAAEHGHIKVLHEIIAYIKKLEISDLNFLNERLPFHEILKFLDKPGQIKEFFDSNAQALFLQLMQHEGLGGLEKVLLNLTGEQITELCESIPKQLPQVLKVVINMAGNFDLLIEDLEASQKKAFRHAAYVPLQAQLISLYNGDRFLQDALREELEKMDLGFINLIRYHLCPAHAKTILNGLKEISDSENRKRIAELILDKIQVLDKERKLIVSDELESLGQYAANFADATRRNAFFQLNLIQEPKPQVQEVLRSNGVDRTPPAQSENKITPDRNPSRLFHSKTNYSFSEIRAACFGEADEKLYGHVQIDSNKVKANWYCAKETLALNGLDIEKIKRSDPSVTDKTFTEQQYQAAVKYGGASRDVKKRLGIDTKINSNNDQPTRSVVGLRWGRR